MNLSKHFTLEELCTSQEALRRGIANDPSPRVIENMRQLCEKILEPLRKEFGPFTPSSCYRCAALNKTIGGAKLSQHVEGKAADIQINGKSLAEVFNWIVANVLFDQIIREFPPGGWVHVSYNAGKERKSKLLALKEGEVTVYKPISEAIVV